MIVADTSVWIPYLNGQDSPETELLDSALADEATLMHPVVLAELLSSPDLPTETEATLLELAELELTPGFWFRAGKLRGTVIARKRKARLADTLVAQGCIDHDVPLLARDADFSAFVRYGGLRLLK